MSIGQMNKRITFQRRDTAADDYGNVEDGTYTDLFTVWGGLTFNKNGRERMEAGALEDSHEAKLKVRFSSDIESITQADRAVIGGVNYQIRSGANLDQHRRFITFLVERGVG